MNWFAKRLAIHAGAALILGPLGPVVGEGVGQIVDLLSEVE